MKLKFMIAFMIERIFVNLIFIFCQIFDFSIELSGLLVIKIHLLIWNKIAYHIQKSFIK